MKEKIYLLSAKKLLLSLFVLIFSCFSPLSAIQTTPVFADEITETTVQEETAEQQNTEQASTEAEEAKNVCSEQSGALGWIICPGTGAISKAIDALYDVIEQFLIIEPLSNDSTSTIHLVWEYVRNITNIVFIIFLIIVVYSQLTGIGITNYGIKRVLPRIIIAAIFVNLSFVICQLAVDISNILGFSLLGFFTSIQETAIANGSAPSIQITWTNLVDVLTGGAALSALGITALVGGLAALFWTAIPVLIGALVSIAIGFITIAMRQAVVALLVMISPLAFVCFLLPNTEKWFEKWKKTLISMIVFYPAFSFLFGASQLAGWAILSSATNVFGILLGLAVQIFPLFFSWSLMKMSGTILGTVNQKLSSLSSKPLSGLSSYAAEKKAMSRTNFFTNSTSFGAGVRKYFDYYDALGAAHTSNLKSIYDNDIAAKVQKRLSGGDIGDKKDKFKTTKYTRAAKKSNNIRTIAANSAAHAEHVLNNYGEYHNSTSADKLLNKESQRAFLDYNRANFVKAVDEENDIDFLTDEFLKANARDKNGNPVDRIAFERYNQSIAGPNGEQRVLAKIIAQSSRSESKRRAEFASILNKYGHNEFNKGAFRSWIAGYYIDDDGWAIDKQGKKILGNNGKPVELIPGEIKDKAPERMVLYDKRDEYGLYYDMKDQSGNIVARIHRGTGSDGENYDDSYFIKEIFANYDIPIADPINNVYSILAGTKPGSVITPQGPNDIGLARYSSTIGRAMNAYKGNAAWSGAMFNEMIRNRQVRNAAQYAIDVCDSTIKTGKPGAFNTQNPASIEFYRTILDPRNWEEIFREEAIAGGTNINGKPWGGEDWVVDENGVPIRDENGNIQYTPVANPTYEQRMNTLKRKYLFPTMDKIIPSIIRNTSPNTVDNQKPGAGDEISKLTDMIESQWVNNPEHPELPDPNVRKYDLVNKTRDLKAKQVDSEGNPIYNIQVQKKKSKNSTNHTNPLQKLYQIYDSNYDIDTLRHSIFSFLEEENYTEALGSFSFWCDENPYATFEDIKNYIDEELSLFLNND